MLVRFNTDAILPADIICRRSETGAYGPLIRSVLGSYTNHNAMLVKKHGQWKIGEAVAPRSKLTFLEDYEEEIAKGEAIVRILRIPEDRMTIQEREAVNDLFLDCCLGLKYPISVARLWVYRFVNRLPWKIHGDWCTRIVWEPCEQIAPGIFDRPPDGKKKKNPTPRTFENRLIAGVVKDVTDEVLVPAARLR